MPCASRRRDPALELDVGDDGTADFRIALSRIGRIRRLAGAGDDEVRVENSVDELPPTMVDGQDGDDAIEGGRGGETLLGGAGDDTVTGGFGDDTIGAMQRPVDRQELRFRAAPLAQELVDAACRVSAHDETEVVAAL